MGYQMCKVVEYYTMTWRLFCILQSGAANEVADPAEVIPAFSADGKTVEVVFSFDTTGSMYGVLAQVKFTRQRFCSQSAHLYNNFVSAEVELGIYPEISLKRNISNSMVFW